MEGWFYGKLALPGENWCALPLLVYSKIWPLMNQDFDKIGSDQGIPGLAENDLIL